jgi:hypothetical protein
MVIGVLEESRVDLHLTRQYRLEVFRHVLPGGDLLVARSQLRIGGNHAEFLLTRERLLANVRLGDHKAGELFKAAPQWHS